MPQSLVELDILKFLECPSHHCSTDSITEYILSITCRVPQSLVKLDILKFLECPSHHCSTDSIQCLSWNSKLDKFYRMQNSRDIRRYSVLVSVHQGAQAKLDRPYALSAPALK